MVLLKGLSDRLKNSFFLKKRRKNKKKQYGENCFLFIIQVQQLHKRCLEVGVL